MTKRLSPEEKLQRQLDSKDFLSDWGFSGRDANICHNCGIRNSSIEGYLIQCAKCKHAYYCSMKCFNEDLATHQKFCNTGRLRQEIERFKLEDIPRRHKSTGPSEDVEEFGKRDEPMRSMSGKHPASVKKTQAVNKKKFSESSPLGRKVPRSNKKRIPSPNEKAHGIRDAGVRTALQKEDGKDNDSDCSSDSSSSSDDSESVSSSDSSGEYVKSPETKIYNPHGKNPQIPALLQTKTKSSTKKGSSPMRSSEIDPEADNANAVIRDQADSSSPKPLESSKTLSERQLCSVSRIIPRHEPSSKPCELIAIINETDGKAAGSIIETNPESDLRSHCKARGQVVSDTLSGRREDVNKEDEDSLSGLNQSKPFDHPETHEMDAAVTEPHKHRVETCNPDSSENSSECSSVASTSSSLSSDPTVRNTAKTASKFNPDPATSTLSDNASSNHGSNSLLTNGNESQADMLLTTPQMSSSKASPFSMLFDFDETANATAVIEHGPASRVNATNFNIEASNRDYIEPPQSSSTDPPSSSIDSDSPERTSGRAFYKCASSMRLDRDDSPESVRSEEHEFSANGQDRSCDEASNQDGTENLQRSTEAPSSLPAVQDSPQRNSRKAAYVCAPPLEIVPDLLVGQDNSADHDHLSEKQTLSHDMDGTRDCIDRLEHGTGELDRQPEVPDSPQRNSRKAASVRAPPLDITRDFLHGNDSSSDHDRSPQHPKRSSDEASSRKGFAPLQFSSEALCLTPQENEGKPANACDPTIVTSLDPTTENACLASHDNRTFRECVDSSIDNGAMPLQLTSSQLQAPFAAPTVPDSPQRSSRKAAYVCAPLLEIIPDAKSEKNPANQDDPLQIFHQPHQLSPELDSRMTTKVDCPSPVKVVQADVDERGMLLGRDTFPSCPNRTSDVTNFQVREEAAKFDHVHSPSYSEPDSPVRHSRKAAYVCAPVLDAWTEDICEHVSQESPRHYHLGGAQDSSQATAANPESMDSKGEPETEGFSSQVPRSLTVHEEIKDHDEAYVVLTELEDVDSVHEDDMEVWTEQIEEFDDASVVQDENAEVDDPNEDGSDSTIIEYEEIIIEEEYCHAMGSQHLTPEYVISEDVMRKAGRVPLQSEPRFHSLPSQGAKLHGALIGSERDEYDEVYMSLRKVEPASGDESQCGQDEANDSCPTRSDSGHSVSARSEDLDGSSAADHDHSHYSRCYRRSESDSSCEKVSSRSFRIGEGAILEREHFEPETVILKEVVPRPRLEYQESNPFQGRRCALRPTPSSPKQVRGHVVPYLEQKSTLREAPRTPTAHPPSSPSSASYTSYKEKRSALKEARPSPKREYRPGEDHYLVFDEKSKAYILRGVASSPNGAGDDARDVVVLRPVPPSPRRPIQFEKPEWVIKSPIRKKGTLEILLGQSSRTLNADNDAAIAQQSISSRDHGGEYNNDDDESLGNFHEFGTTDDTKEKTMDCSGDTLIHVLEIDPQEVRRGRRPEKVPISPKRPTPSPVMSMNACSPASSPSLARQIESKKPSWALKSPLRTTERGLMIKSKCDITKLGSSSFSDLKSSGVEKSPKPERSSGAYKYVSPHRYRGDYMNSMAAMVEASYDHERETESDNTHPFGLRSMPTL